MLVDALINAACRLGIDTALERALEAGALPEHGEERQVSQALAILDNFIAWLGFQQREAALRFSAVSITANRSLPRHRSQR